MPQVSVPFGVEMSVRLSRIRGGAAAACLSSEGGKMYPILCVMLMLLGREIPG